VKKMLADVKKAQFYTMAVAVIAIALITTSIIIVGIRNSVQNVEISEDIYFVFDNIKRETLERIELVLANLTQMNKTGVTFDYLEITKSYLDLWISCLKNEYESRGFKISLNYDPSQISYFTYWNKSISMSALKIIISIQIENEDVKIKQTVNATHVFKLYINKIERIGSTISVEVNFTKIVGNSNETSIDYAVVYVNDTRANYVGGGVYRTELVSLGPGSITIYVAASAPSGTFVEACSTQ